MAQLLKENEVSKLTPTAQWPLQDYPEEEIVTTRLMGRKQKGSAVQQTAYLVHIYPKCPDMGRRYRLSQSLLVIGRDPTCDIWLQEESVSRRHACIQPVGGHYEILDLESTNGTFVNDHATAQRVLRDGDYVHIGNCIFRFLTGGNVEAEYHEEIYRLTIIDALTGIANNRCLLEFLDRELSRSHRHDRPLSLIMFDVDHFKSVNDRLGHLGGDYSLRELANCVKKTIRTEEIFARYGGEEFAIVLPETELQGAIEMAERVRQLVEGHFFQFDGQTYPMTISLGVSYTRGEPDLTSVDFIRRADENLYKAKENGRNCVIAE